MYFVGKYAYNEKNAFNATNSQLKNIYTGKVISVNDSDSLGRIKVRVLGLDNHLSDNEVPFAFPMMTKFLSITPQVGEAVLIFRWDSDSKYEDRMYLGPIISQSQQLEFDPYDTSAFAGFSWGTTEPKPSPDGVKELKGVFPDKEFVSIQGKNNTDLIFKDGEVVLRAGKFIKKGDSDDSVGFPNGFDLKFNRETPSYFQMRYDTPITRNSDINKQERGSVTNIVANKINLLTHKDGSPRFNLSNQDNLISNDEILNILENAHPLVFGDKLIELIRLFIDALNNHVHSYHGKKWEDLGSANTIKKLNSFSLDTILSNNIKIN